MIKSPLIQELRAEVLQEVIVEILKDRFGTVPRGLVKQLNTILSEKTLKKLNLHAAKCPDLNAFRERLLS